MAIMSAANLGPKNATAGFINSRISRGQIAQHTAVGYLNWRARAPLLVAESALWAL